MDLKTLGERMNDEGGWSEFHQKKARAAPNLHAWSYHDEMYRWHHGSYMRLKRQYDETVQDRER